MTFFKVNDPKNRELIKEVIAKRSIIREADRRRKMGDAFEFEQLSRFFKPITQQVEKTTEKIEKGVRRIPGEIAKVLPRSINLTRNITQQMQPTEPPPAYELPFAEEDEIPSEIKEKEKDLPVEVEKTKDGYKIGDIIFNVDKNKKKILVGDKEYTNSPKIYNILTNTNSKITWNDLNENEKKKFAELVVKSDVLYKNYNDGSYNQFNNTVKWRNLYSPIWYNRFLYMDNERLKSDIEIEHMKKSLRYVKIKEKLLPETINLINKQLIGEGLKGSGLKKDYVTLPSNPSELVDRLTLLSGSKDAGNTGVYNEMVSICDELLKRKIIGKGQYKQFLSNI